MDKIERALNWIIPLLEKHRISFHITGGFGAHLLGATRPVNDIDIDIPSSAFKLLKGDIAPYITFGPERHKDTTWDLEVAVLHYFGQDIDLTGASDARVHNKNTGAWDKLLIDFSSVVYRSKYGLKLPVQNPRHLIEYKTKIAFDEAKHLEDIEAIRRADPVRQ